MPITTKKHKLIVSIDDDVETRLENIGERYGMTKNTIVAAAAYELSRVSPEMLWQALSRISGEEAAKARIPGKMRELSPA